MKKTLSLFLVLLLSCGPSEAEIQEQADADLDALFSTSTTSTTIKKVEWTPSEIKIDCPSSKDLMYGSEFKAGFDVIFGSTPREITLYFDNLDEEQEETLKWTPSIDPQTTWEKGYRKSSTFYDIESLGRDIESFFFAVIVKDASGVVRAHCNVENDTDIYTLPTIVETTVCPSEASQKEEIVVEISILSRTVDVKYVQWEFQDDTLAKNFSDLIVTEEMPKKGYKGVFSSVTYTTGNFNSSGNLSIIATVYDALGRYSKAVCGIVLKP